VGQQEALRLWPGVVIVLNSLTSVIGQRTSQAVVMIWHGLPVDRTR
jgi:hypothetical protein